MKVFFDVIAQPWIPVVDLQGERKELGILDVLTHAHELKRIQDSSPLVEYSVYRFLIVFLMDAFRPETEEDLQDYLSEEQFDPEVLNTYIAQCRAEGVSFDLFDEKRPFMQSVYREEWDREPKSAGVMDYTVPSGNNPIHFDHCRKREHYSPGKALRMLLEAQIFCTAGAQDYPSNVNGAPPWYAMVDGENLFQSLVFSMISTDSIDIPFDEPPVLWRCNEPIIWKQKIAKTSWLMGMLFPARRIHLIPREDGTVGEIYLSQGMNYISTSWLDPHVTYRYNDKGRFNWKPSDDEAVWRNIRDLMDIRKQHAPQIVAQYRGMNYENEFVPLILYGVQTSKASYLSVRRHDLKLPNTLLGDEDVLNFLQKYIRASEALAKAVCQSIQSEEIPQEMQSQARQHFHGMCEKEMWSLMEGLERQEDLDELYCTELETLCAFARESAKWAIEQLNLRGKTMLKVMKNQQLTFAKTIKALKKEG